jgi:hypothetical protein
VAEHALVKKKSTRNHLIINRPNIDKSEGKRLSLKDARSAFEKLIFCNSGNLIFQPFIRPTRRGNFTTIFRNSSYVCFLSKKLGDLSKNLYHICPFARALIIYWGEIFSHFKILPFVSRQCTCNVKTGLWLRPQQWVRRYETWQTEHVASVCTSDINILWVNIM